MSQELFKKGTVVECLDNRPYNPFKKGARYIVYGTYIYGDKLILRLNAGSFFGDLDEPAERFKIVGDKP